MTDPEPIPVRLMSQILPMSNDLAMDYGLIPDTRPPVIVTRRQRLRWWWQDKRRAARMRLASAIAGFDVEERD